MCLPAFHEFKQIDKNNLLIGYRSWRNLILQESLILKSEYQDYEWKTEEGPHLVLNQNSGIYSYNYYNNNNYYDNYHYHYYYQSYYYYISGIISHWGNTAIHETGYRSEYAKINSLFTIRELDAVGPKDFINWIKLYNEKINKIAEKYECNTIYWQDYSLKIRRGEGI